MRYLHRFFEKACSKPSRSDRSGIPGNRPGAALIVLVFTMTVLAVLGAAIFSMNTSSSYSELFSNNRAKSYYLAEAGGRFALLKIREDLPNALANIDAIPGTYTLANGRGSFEVAIDNSSSDKILVHSTGVLHSGDWFETRVQVTYRIAKHEEGGIPDFKYGVFADDVIALKGQGFVDSYDSDEGPYGGEGSGTGGDVATNSTDAPAIDLGGKAKIYGDASTGPESDPATTIPNDSAVSGSTGALEQNIDLPTPVDPGGGDPLSVSGAGNTTVTVTEGAYRLDDLTLSSKRTVVIQGEVTLYVDGDFKTSGQSRIVVPDGSKLTLYINGSIDMSGQGIVNDTGIPANVMMLGTETCTSVKLSGQEDLYAAVYAPEADIQLSGQSDVYGAIVGKTFTAQGQASIHYDEALGDMGGGSESGDVTIGTPVRYFSGT